VDSLWTVCGQFVDSLWTVCEFAGAAAGWHMLSIFAQPALLVMDSLASCGREPVFRASEKQFSYAWCWAGIASVRKVTESTCVC
jgi:hypothetical protein